MSETPTVYWPDESVEFGFTFGMSFNTIETEFSNRRRQARLLDPRPRRTLEGRVPAVTWDTSESIRSFITARGGNFESFNIFAWPYQKFTAFRFGTGTGTATEFALPFKGGLIAPGSITNVKANGVLKFLNDDYTLGTYGTGDNRIDFTSPGSVPGPGAVLIADIIGRERIPVKLNGNVLQVEHPLHRSQDASGPADFYTIPVIEVF